MGWVAFAIIGGLFAFFWIITLGMENRLCDWLTLLLGRPTNDFRFKVEEAYRRLQGWFERRNQGVPDVYDTLVDMEQFELDPVIVKFWRYKLLEHIRTVLAESYPEALYIRPLTDVLSKYLPEGR